MAWEEAKPWAYPIRLTVFVKEQRVPKVLELDEDDPGAWHAVVFQDGRAIATGRLLANGKIGRLAVLQSYRGHGVGSDLLKKLIEFGQQQTMTKFYLHAQTRALGFYKRIGFKAIDPVFDEAGIEHIKMVWNAY